MRRTLSPIEIIDLKIALRFTALNDEQTSNGHKAIMIKLAAALDKAEYVAIYTGAKKS